MNDDSVEVFSSNDILQNPDKHISWFKNGIKNILPSANLTPKKIVDSIRDIGLLYKTSELRRITDKNKNNEFKAQFPYVTWSGTFLKRSKDGFEKHSGLICLDFDHLGERLEGIKNHIKKDEYTFIVFTSPNGDGLKVVVQIGDDPADHLEHFFALQQYFYEKYNIRADDAAKDIPRACFLCHDDNVFFNPQSQTWTEKSSHPMDRTPRNGSPIKEPIEVGNRNNSLTSAAGRLRKNGFDEPEILEVLTEKNRQLSEPLPQKEVNSITHSVAQYPYAISLTDTGNACRMAQKFGDFIRYSDSIGHWFIWSKKHWKEDYALRIEFLAKKISKDILKEAEMCLDKDTIKSLTKWAKHTSNYAAIKNMINLAKSEPPIPATPETFDSDDWLLNVQNGTIELETCKLREHRQTDSITKISPVTYDPTATCPNWEKFINQIFAENNDTINFVQKMIGYSFTGDTREQVLFILWGTGGNGKSLFINTIKDILGTDFFSELPADTLFVKQLGGSSNDIAMLRGQRVAVSNENDTTARLKEGLIKSLTGGDPITARFMRQNFFTYTPKFKLFLITNHKPKIRDTTASIWRRIRLIPFNQCFTDKPDLSLNKKFKGELSGILNWSLEGLKKWMVEGLGSCSEVTEAVKSYKTESDPVQRFIDDYCVIDKFQSETAADLYENFSKWAIENGEYQIKQTSFGKQLAEKGFKKSRKMNGNIYIGIGMERME